MVGSGENILVEFDCQNIILVDPNKTITDDGKVQERLLPHENLVYYANLECSLYPRTRLSVGSSNETNLQTISIAKINFLKPGDKIFLTNEYLNEITGLNSIEGNGTNQIKINDSSLHKSNKTSEQYASQTVINNIDTELLGITQINVSSNLSFMPEVTIQMEDIRGRALFEKGENSPYAAFFNLPYPLFYLTIKGYLGQAIKYQLALKTFGARFDTSTGNFKIEVKFYAYKYNILTQIPMSAVLNVPYMYPKNYEISPVNTPQLQSSANAIGNTTQSVQNIVTTRGYQKIKEVYSEYKAKGIIDINFPEITILELISRLEGLETYIANTFATADLLPLTDGYNYDSILNEYEGEIYVYVGESFVDKFLDKTNFFVLKNGNILYGFSKKIETEKQNDGLRFLEGLIIKFNERLSQNETYGKGVNKLSNPITYEMIVRTITISEIDIVETYIQRNGTTITDYSEFYDQTATLLSSVNNKLFYIEGKNSFAQEIGTLRTQLRLKMEEIQTQLTDILSSRIQSTEGGLGFNPTIKNIIAVLLSNAEAFIRLLCDVHTLAWDVREDKDRFNAIVGTDNLLPNSDVKNYVSSTNSKNIIYPWPQYFVSKTDESGEKYILTYPGDPKEVSKTKGYRYEKWPEIEFVEEFIKAQVLTKDSKFKLEENFTPNTEQIINRISLNAMDFPTKNTIFANRQEVKFLYEIYERIFLMANYQRFLKPESKNQLMNLLAETEFINIQNALSIDSPNLIRVLKNYNINSNNIIGLLYKASNNGIGESWQKFIRGDFATTYIQNEVDNSFNVIDNSVLNTKTFQIQPQPKELDRLTEYLKTQHSNSFDFTDTFPYNVDGWFSYGLANGVSSNKKNSMNTTKVLEVNEYYKMICNFGIETPVISKRPVVNFSYLNESDNPTPDNNGTIDFYANRLYSEMIPTEGALYYPNYGGNINNTQTTSILNTPYFVNAIQDGVNQWLTGNNNPYVAAAFLFLNSLPLATLREKYKTFENETTIDLDYIFASFKKFGAIHKIPYAWILKYGSIWHRYKKWTETGVDILQSSWTDFDRVNNFDPITSDPNKVYNLTINGQPQDIGSQYDTVVGGSAINNMNVGFYPKTINDFNIFLRGYDILTGYTNSDIQSQINNTQSGITLVYGAESSFQMGDNYDPTNPNELLNFKTWSVVLSDNLNSKQYVLPSFGTNINQTNTECIKNGQATTPIKSNPSVFNGSIRMLWAAPNYGYFNNSDLIMPSPEEYFKQILPNTPEQQTFSLSGGSSYTKIDETLSVFDRQVLDAMESEFLKYSKSVYEYEIVQQNNQATAILQFNELLKDTTGMYKNFHIFMREMMSLTPTTFTNSKDYVTDISNKQLTNFYGLIKGFMEYDVAVRYANPSNFERKVFDSFSTSNFIEDKLSFQPYITGTLPGDGSTTTLIQSIASHPQTWKDLKTYVGFSTIPDIVYSDSGSTITDFFIDMKVEFSSYSVKTLAPLIKIYATQKKIDPTLNETKFTTLVNTYLTSNKEFSDGVLNLLSNKLQQNLPTIKESSLDNKVSALNGEQTKLHLWEKFKEINDTWISGYDFTQTTFMEDVLLMDRANRDIGDKIIIDPFKVRNLLENINEGGSVYSYLNSIMTKHNFVMMMHPGYVNYYNVQEVSRESSFKTEGSLEFANNLFGTFLNVDTRKSSPKLVCTYAYQPSKYLELGSNTDFQYNNDSFKMDCGSPLIDKLEGKTNWAVTNRVVGFNVDVGIRNQNIFYYFDVSQDLGKQTAEAIWQLNNMINQANGKGVATQNSSLWNFYNSRSYTAKVQCLGNALIQPTMYFNVSHVPMFSGPYYITEVTQNITSGRFETTFTGIRQQVFALPTTESYMQTLTKQLFTTLTGEIKQIVNTNPNGKQSGSSEQNKGIVRSGGQASVGSNCSGNLNNVYVDFKYVFVNNVATEINTQELSGVINSPNNTNTEAKVLSFVSMWLESFNGTNFKCWNNNYSGVRLSLSQGKAMSIAYFKNEYSCQQLTDGSVVPYAVFETKEKHIQFLYAFWNDKVKFSPFEINSSNVFDKWYLFFNRSPHLDIGDVLTFINTNPNQYNLYIKEIENALKVAQTMSIF